MKKKVCIVTAARSEYGLLRWVIDEVYRDSELEFQLVVTGAHLSEEQGLTYRQIEADGYPIAAKVDMRLNSTSKASIAESMGHCSIGFSHTLSELQPDLLVVLGDRYTDQSAEVQGCQCYSRERAAELRPAAGAVPLGTEEYRRTDDWQG